MGELKDIISTIGDINREFKNSIKDAGVFSVKRSISAKAMDGTCVFPALADTSVPMEDLITITRALERKYASFVLTTLTMDPYLSTDKDLDAADYVRRFHQNMSFDTGRTKVGITALEEMETKHGIDYSYLEEDAKITAYHVYSCIESKLANRQIEKWNYVIEDVANPRSLNQLSCPRRSVMEASSNVRRDNANSKGATVHVNSGGNLMGDISVGTNTNTFNPTNNANPININNNNPNINPNISPTFNIRSGGGRSPMNHSVDSEMKKANDLVPTMLHIRVYPKSDRDCVELPEPIDFVLGVKVNLIPITPEIMAEQLAKGVNADNAFFNFIKFTTGETKFFKDFVFAVDKQKSAAIDMRSTTKGWFAASKRRGNAGRILSRMMKDKNYSAIMSIIVSNDTINRINELYGYDFNKAPVLVDKLMETYWLLGFITVDTSLERVNFKLDGQAPETLTLNTLLREETKDDKKFREMMKMIGRSI